MSGGFVKLDSGILNSSLWFARDLRSVFLTALIMADPYELKEATPQIEVRSLNYSGWVVPAGWYGLVEAAGVGIIRRDGLADQSLGLSLLEELCAPDEESRSSAFEGRRMARINGGFVILNYFSYREKDYRRKDPSGAADSYVYYARSGEVVKIGQSKNPWARMADLRVGRPDVVIVATERGDRELENLRHEQFKDERIGGEWFTLSSRLALHIQSVGHTTVATPVATKKQRSEEEAKAVSTSSSSSPDDVERLLVHIKTAASRQAWQAEIDGARQGMRGKALTDAQVQTACRDFVANGHAQNNPSLNHFRGFLRSATAEPKAKASGGSVRASKRREDHVYTPTTVKPGWKK